MTARRLPANCPLRKGREADVPDECRFAPRLLRALMRSADLPNPDGGCPVIMACVLAKEGGRRGDA